MAYDLTDADLGQLEQRGISREEFERQLECFRRGFPPLEVVGPATPDHGIEVIDDDARRAELVARGREASSAGRLMKFVPASGAASRMFKALAGRLQDPRPLDPAALAEARGGSSDDALVARFFDRFDDFAFAAQVRDAVRAAGHEPEQVLDGDGDRRVVLRVLLEDLDFADRPKGLIPFHRTPDGVRTAFEEQLDETSQVVADRGGRGRVHFTVPPEFYDEIEQHCAAARTPHEVGFSVQSPSTDTVAVDLRDQPLRDDDGRLVFRPGGHGALIGNLDALHADVVLIKNIDNVVPRERRDAVVENQHLLAGVLLERQAGAHELWRKLHDGVEVLDEAMDFVQSWLHRTPPDPVLEGGPDSRRAWLFDVLARPLRVCGMVRNEGEPGGGPFRVRAADGGLSLQIVESSQVDHDDPEQEKHFRASTHFNPVDLVCGVKDYKGHAFSLFDFRDPSAGLISTKSKGGRSLKAQELPGLWNGGMARWNTLFVEVPLITFNPVKTVNDLLREEHQQD